MDTTVRTLRLETSKKGRPNAPHHPSSAESRQRDLDAPIPKELGDGEMLDSYNRKKESKMVAAEDKERKSPQKWNRRKSEDWSGNLR